MERFKEIIGQLRPYQNIAITKINSYLSSDSVKQALVKMPMGTGKTIVISITSSILAQDTSVLIVAPSTAVKNQLIFEIQQGCWDKLGVDYRPSQEVCGVIPSSLIVKESPTIYVTTIQALVKLKNDSNEGFRKLQQVIGLIIFDEGHREPAEAWRGIIRSFEKKSILFTATPIRNDKNKFNLDENFIFSYSHQEALSDQYIRQTEFKLLPNINDPREFANEIFTRYQDYIEEFDESDSGLKCIIRCGDSDTIQSMVEELEGKVQVIGIHENFVKSSNPNLITQVPSDIQNRSEKVWIHQYKLIEGIDNKQFCVLAIFDPLSDSRSLVQQVGRVIRKGDFEINALVLIKEKDAFQMDWWNSYINFEQLLSNNPENLMFNYEEYFNQVRDANPTATYMENRFLRRFDLEREHDSYEKLKKYQLPLKVNIYKNQSRFDKLETIKTIFSIILYDLHENDYLILDEFEVDSISTGCIVYSRYENSNILVNESFLEVKLEIILFRLLNNKLYIYSSTTYLPSLLSEGWKRINANTLKQLLLRDSKVSQVTIQNGGVSHNNFSRMIMDAEDVSSMTPDITDKYNLCTTLVGSKKVEKSTIRNYLGFSNARVSQSDKNVDLLTYIGWLDKIDAQLSETSKEIHPIFNRFATVTDVPNELTPSSILIYFDPNIVFLTYSYGTLTELDQLFYTVRNSKFNLRWDNRSFEINIAYSMDEGRYILKYSEGTEKLNIVVNQYNKGKIELLDWLNEEQSFQIILKGNLDRYFKGTFFKTGIPSDFDSLINIMDEYEIDLPGNVKLNEKGANKSAILQEWHNAWDKNSLFHLVANRGIDINNNAHIKSLLSDADYIICTDLQTEVADFITISESKETVSFIHCKAGKSKLSATTFQEVSGQIIKNLDYVNKGSTKKPIYDYWDKEWKHESYRVKVNRKIANPHNLTASEIWSKLKDIQQSPTSKTYVIALMGNAFSKSSYLNEKRKQYGDQKPEIIQIDYLLNQTAIAVQRAQAEFILSFNKC